MSEARDLAEAHTRAFNERAWNRAAEIYAPDLMTVEPGGTIRGIDAFVGHGQGFAAAFPDSKLEVTTIIESGRHAVAEGVYTGAHTGGRWPPRRAKSRPPAAPCSCPSASSSR
jgi:predicted ester cyclase